MGKTSAAWALLATASALVAPPARGAWPPPMPRQLVLTVRETAGVARQGEVVRSGVPLPRALGIADPATLTIVDAEGRPVPADFRALARWRAARDDVAQPIQWLLVTFPATVGASGSAVYRLVTDGSAGPNPVPPLRLAVDRQGDRVTVDTGAARFVLGGDSGALFDDVVAGYGQSLLGDSRLSAVVEGGERGHPATRAVRVEHAGPLSAVVVVEGAYDMPAVGGGGLGSFRRYVFSAGSPVVVVRHAVAWEGDRCGAGTLACGGAPNAVRVERLRDTLRLTAPRPLTVTAIGARAAAALEGTAAAGATAHVRQRLRADRHRPPAFEVAVPGADGGGGKADGALLAVAGARSALAVALDHMHRYEPQALRLLADGSLAVDLADGPAWLGSRQGLFATFAVGAFPEPVPRQQLERQVWAPLNHPLRAWPQAEWFAASEAVEEFPAGALPPDLADYDSLVAGVLERTREGIDRAGLTGLATFGSYPRLWGNALYADELDCGGGDPTPAETWDDAYWCGVWTDYHGTTATAVVRALRTGEVEWLDEIAFPGALRMLHTQVFQCAPGDPTFYCGQAPAGYGGFRADFNSSHQYFENLILYAWLAGDETVARTLARGAASMRGFLCPARGGDPPGPTCAADDPPADPWAGLSGRVASQFAAVFRFVGLAGDDATFLDDWTANAARALTLAYAAPEREGRRLGLIAPTGNGSFDFVEAPGSYWSEQLWMASLYDANVLHRLGVDSGDAPLGAPPVPPSAAVASWARTLEAASRATPWSTGGAAGPWPNQLRFTWSGDRIGGRLDALATEELDGDGDGVPCEICDDDGGACRDLCLYETGKAPLGATLLRAADSTGDPRLAALGEDLTRHALAAALADLQPLNKLTGEYLARLHAAVARLAARRPAPGLRFITPPPCRAGGSLAGGALTAGSCTGE